MPLIDLDNTTSVHFDYRLYRCDGRGCEKIGEVEAPHGVDLLPPRWSRIGVSFTYCRQCTKRLLRFEQYRRAWKEREASVFARKYGPFSGQRP